MSIVSQFRLLIPEEIELFSEDYVLAQEWSNKRGGKPCVRKMRVTVYDVLDWLAQKIIFAKII